MEDRIKGGYRLKGQSSVKESGRPLVSVITVVYNGVNLLERTLNSILDQTYRNIEYIIIDGGSSDGTVDIIRRYDNRIAYWISEPDRGLYDAMNKGLETATGDYLWFLNAGDLAYREDTLETVFQSRETRYLILFGDTMVVDSDYHEVGLRRLRPPEVLTWRSFRKGMLVCHQAILVHRSLAGPYDLQYKHSADFDWVLRAIIKAEGQEGRRAGRKGERRKEKGERQGKRKKAIQF